MSSLAVLPEAVLARPRAGGPPGAAAEAAAAHAALGQLRGDRDVHAVIAVPTAFDRRRVDAGSGSVQVVVVVVVVVGLITLVRCAELRVEAIHVRGGLGRRTRPSPVHVLLLFLFLLFLFLLLFGFVVCRQDRCLLLLLLPLLLSAHEE